MMRIGKKQVVIIIMKKAIILFCLVLNLVISKSFSQYTDTATMRTIENNKSAYEGDLYLDTNVAVYKIGLSNGKLGYLTDNQDIDSIKIINDSLFFYLQNSNPIGYPLDSIGKNSAWNKIGTNNASTDISDSIYTNGIVRLTNYPETRADDTSSYLNVLYTNSDGDIRSARREIIPPTAFINATTVAPGNSFNYYNHYTAQMNLMGLPPIPLANLDFYVFSYDPAVFNNVSISPLGVLSYDVIAVSDTKTFIDVRFITK